MKAAVIDLDSLGYIVAYQQYKSGNKGDSKRVSLHIKDFISSILTTVGAEYYMMFYQDSGHTNFRKEIYSEYKANRPDTPDFYKCWKNTVIETFKDLGAIALKTIESDDALSIVNKTVKNYGKSFVVNNDSRQRLVIYLEDLIFCHNDKDMFQLPGMHYLFTKAETVTISEQEAFINLYRQILMGDNIDNIKGISGCGPKRAEKILSLAKTEEDLKLNTVAKYGQVYGDSWREEYIKTRLLVELLEPNQQYESISKKIEWIKNDNLLSTTSLFESGKSMDINDLFY